MSNVRIKDLATDSALAAGDYIIVDSETEGTRKYDIGAGLAGKVNKPAGNGTSGQVLKTNGDGTTRWENESGGGGGTSDYTDLSNKPKINNVELSGNKSASDLGLGTYTKPSGGIPASDMASGVIPSAATNNPADLGTAAKGTSTKYAREDHVHKKPSVSDIGAAPAVTEVTVSTAGSVSQALDAGKIYHFTGSLTALTITLNTASGVPAQYHFDFTSGATAPTVTLPNTVKMPDGFTVEANKRYEIDILNNYGVVQSWATS